MKLLYSLLVILISVTYAIAAGVYVIKVEKSLNIRKGGSTNSAVVGHLKNGDHIYVTEIAGGWAKFYKGWVSTKYISRVRAAGNYKTTANLNFRTGPSTNYKILSTLSKGTVITLYGKDPFNSAWGVTGRGYASMKYLEKVGSGNNSPSTPESKPKSNGKRFEIIDVSRHNTITNYATVAKNVDGVIMRCGYRGYGTGKNVVDENFTKNYNGFKGKTKIGYYFVSQAISTTEAVAEADFVIDHIKGKQNDFPIYLDSEWSNGKHNGRADGLSKKARTDYAIAFLNRLKSKNYRVGVYANNSWFLTDPHGLEFNRITATGASIWVARYGNEPTVPKYDIWQWTESGSLAGINGGKVDKNHVYSNIAGW